MSVVVFPARRQKRRNKRRVHFSDGLGPVCGIESNHAIGVRSPAFPAAIDCAKCLKKMRGQSAMSREFLTLVKSL